MVPNAKKTKQLLIATRQKLQHVNKPTLDLYLNANRVEEAENDHLSCHSHMKYFLGSWTPEFIYLKERKATSISTQKILLYTL